MENYPSVIPFTPSYLEHCKLDLDFVIVLEGKGPLTAQ